MIQTETLFILGAGASIPYGFPSGERLVENIISNLNAAHYTEKLIYNDFFKDLIARFKYKLSNSNLKSIDVFLEHQNDEMKLLGKAAIAQELINYKDYKYIDKTDDWYRELWNAMVTKHHLIPENKVSFITFNYDLSLEHYLHKSIISTFDDLPESVVSTIFNSFRIVHLHGKLGVEPWNRSNSHDIDIMEAAKGIKIISDQTIIDEDFSVAHSLIRQAGRIYFMGFGYHPINIERLRVPELLKNKVVVGNSFGLTDLECEQIEHNLEIAGSLCKTHIWNNLNFFRQKVQLN